MIVVGIDGGMIRLGLSAVSITEDRLELEGYDLISTPRGEESYNTFLTHGITQIVNIFPRFLDQVRPDIIVSETIPVGKLGSSNSQVVAAVTTCHVIAIQFGIPWKNIAANTVKKMVTEDGRANKTKIRNTMLDLFPEVVEAHAKEKQAQKKEGLKKRPGLAQDLFDAIAVSVAGALQFRKLYTEFNDEHKALQEMQEG